MNINTKDIHPKSRMELLSSTVFVGHWRDKALDLSELACTDLGAETPRRRFWNRLKQ